MMRKPQLLVIDDGLTYARLVAERMPEFELVRAGPGDEGLRLADGPAALAFLEQHIRRIDVVLLDVNFDIPEDRLLPLDPPTTLRRTRRYQGLAILTALRRRFPALPVVLLTAIHDLSLVEAGQAAAAQSMTYFLDSDDLDALRIRINAALQEAAAAVEEAGILWGADAVMRALRRRLAVVSRGRMPVILEGETGTGKSYLAEHFIHANSGRKGPFVAVDLAALPRDLVAAHLFGATRGAYTGAVADRKGLFEQADDGTLFLDEVQNIPMEVQKQLLLVLQDRRVRPLGANRQVAVDVKVIAATNSSLAEAVAAGRFRRDLYMRLSPATLVTIPPLRERPDDLVFLARQFMEQSAREAGNRELLAAVGEAAGLGTEPRLHLVTGGGRPRVAEGTLAIAVPKPAWDQLQSHHWPGNVRELQTVMENLLSFTLVAAADALRAGYPLTTSRLQVDPGLVSTLLAGYAALPADGAAPTPEAPEQPGTYRLEVTAQESLNRVSNEVEKQYLVALFRETGGDFEAMAKRLLDDPDKGRAVRLRFNQLGLKVRELR